MKYLWKLERGNYVTKNTILTKRIMLGVLGWRYLGRSYLPFKCGIPKKERHSCFVAFNENNERVNIGKTIQEAETFCLEKYKEFYETHPEEHDWLPSPYERRKVRSEIIVIKTE